MTGQVDRDCAGLAFDEFLFVLGGDGQTVFRLAVRIGPGRNHQNVIKPGGDFLFIAGLAYGDLVELDPVMGGLADAPGRLEIELSIVEIVLDACKPIRVAGGVPASREPDGMKIDKPSRTGTAD